MKVKVKSIDYSVVHIGNGNAYSSIFLKGLERLNEAEIFEKFAKKEGLEERILKGISLEELKKFVEAHEFKKLYLLKEVDAQIPSVIGEIQEVIKHSNQPYLPGSSIKGALLTAFLYDKLLNLRTQELLDILRKLEGKNLPSYLGRLQKKFKLELKVSDCILKEYSLKVGWVWVGTKKFPIEVIDEFEGEFLLETNVENLLDLADKFSREYLAKLEKLKEISSNDRGLVKNVRNSKEKLLILGRFANLFSKSLQLLIEKRNLFYRRVKKPSWIRIFEINGKRKLLGIVRIG